MGTAIARVIHSIRTWLLVELFSIAGCGWGLGLSWYIHVFST